ncbi:MAG: hypothetical protein WDM90_01520 [Ferruginibacter sp.]
MRYILTLIILCVFCLNSKCQTADSKIIYVKFIEEITSNYIGKRNTILIYDSIANWDEKGNYELVSKVRGKHKLQTSEWDSLMNHFSFNPQSELIYKYFNLHSIASFKRLKFKYSSQKPANANLLGYWCIYLCPLYFNIDATKCIAVANFFAGNCSTGAKRFGFFEKNKEGIWSITKSFKE